MVLAKPLSRILYVDDDASMRELVRTALADQSEFTVVTCSSGFEALIIVGVRVTPSMGSSSTATRGSMA